MLLKNKKEIDVYLNRYNIKNYELIKDEEYGYVVNVKGGVDLSDRGLISIDVKFNIIDGDFDCCDNKLKSLEWCPEIVNGSFYCPKNKLTSIKEGPKIIKGDFNCCDNQLMSLEGCQEIINGNFDCSNNKLKSLIGSPKVINGSFICGFNELRTLEYFPKIIGEICSLYGNLLEKYNLYNLLNDVDIKSNYIYLANNKDLGELQDIEDFNEFKKILKIYQEKENLDIFMIDNLKEVPDRDVESNNFTRSRVVEKLKLLIKNNYNKV